MANGFWDSLHFYQQLDNLLFNLCTVSHLRQPGFDTEVFVGFVLCGGSASVWARGSEFVWATVALEKSCSSRIFIFYFFCLFQFFGLCKQLRHTVVYKGQLRFYSSADQNVSNILLHRIHIEIKLVLLIHYVVVWMSSTIEGNHDHKNSSISKSLWANSYQTFWIVSLSTVSHAELTNLSFTAGDF